LLIGLLLSALVTQLMLAQLARGQVTAPLNDPPIAPEARFVPGTARFAQGATLEIRAEALVIGSDVKLRQIARWSSADAAVFEPIADLVMLRLGPTTPNQSISVQQIKGVLHDAGVNLAAITMVGAGVCTVGRSDVQFDEGAALEAWMANRDVPVSPEKTVPANQPLPQPAAEPPAILAAQAIAPEQAGVRTLRHLLTDDLARQLQLPAESLQLTFKPQDDNLLRLAEPQFRFSIQPLRTQDLGDVSWNVTLVGDTGSQRVTVAARAQAWQQQLVLVRPLSPKQLIRDEDVEERRTLADRLAPDPLITRPQAVGQQASRDLKPGTVLTSRHVDAVPLARPGQLVTVMISEGAVQIRTVGRALDGGTYGQSIRIRNEQTREIYRAVLVGPQEAALGPAGASGVAGLPAD
jgi:flagella basal body P-ring formation protein FlgA